MKSKRMEFHNKFLIVSAMLAVISWLSLGVVSFPMLAGTLGISTKAAATVVNLISAYSTVTAVISIVGAITGVGFIGSGIAATVLYILKKKGAAKAALW
ncbi:TPA: uberolysin/carnocyclin family circular bacteriocin [Streptococcus pneumoniae]|nr:uberolysin/carnocyclin family circular bacteriocin [Streptococcus pneumoniae]